MSSFIRFGSNVLSNPAFYRSITAIPSLRNGYLGVPLFEKAGMNTFCHVSSHTPLSFSSPRETPLTNRVSFIPRNSFQSLTPDCNSCFSMAATPPVYDWGARIQKNPLYLDLEVEDLAYLDSLPRWVREHGIDVRSIAFPYERLQKRMVKNLLSALSEYYPELPGFGIRKLQRGFGKIEIISHPSPATIDEKGNEMAYGEFPHTGIQLDGIPLKREYLDVLADQIVKNSEENFVVLILSEEY